MGGQASAFKTVTHIDPSHEHGVITLQVLTLVTASMPQVMLQFPSPHPLAGSATMSCCL